jgi:nickel-dependent lactate racemase
MGDIPQSLYEAMRKCELAWNGVSHLQFGFSGGLEMWLPTVQGIADKDFS